MNNTSSLDTIKGGPIKVSIVAVMPDEAVKMRAVAGERLLSEDVVWRDRPESIDRFCNSVALAYLTNGGDASDIVLQSDCIREDITRLLRKPARKPRKPQKTPEEQFGPPIPLDSKELHELQSGILIGPIGEMIDAVADELEVPRELPLTFALAALGGALQAKFAVRLEADYYEPLCIYAITAMESANRKTPAMQRMIKPIYDWERQKAVELEPSRRSAEIERELAQARFNTLKAKAEKTTDQNEYALLKNQLLEIEKTIPTVPVIPRLVVEDCTSERLATIMAEQGGRIAMVSDEGGIFATMAGRYSAGVANIDVYLKSHSGSTLVIDRGNRQLRIDRPLMSVGISPQPCVVSDFVNNREFADKGLCARFIYFLPTSKLGNRELTARRIPPQVTEAYNDRITSLLNIPALSTGPRILTLTSDAWKRWKDFQRRVEKMLGKDGQLADMTSWGGKLAGAVGRLAGLMHCAEIGDIAIKNDQISDDTMGRAIKLAILVIEHSTAAISGADKKGAKKTAQRIWETIQKTSAKRANPLTVTARECWHPHRGTYHTVAEIEPGIALLIDHNYLNEIETLDLGRAGRPKRQFAVNPSLLKSGQSSK